MAAAGINGVPGGLRKVVLRHEGGGLTDGQLLECFLVDREEGPFTALVQRHGRMVMGVCRRVLLNVHDAEDAFQATFLVLARKAATIAPRDAVGAWLYGVAYRTARKARAMTAKRRLKEQQFRETRPAATTAEDAWEDLQPLLDEELSRLPQQHQSAIVLCDLEGKTKKEAAAQLRCPEGTLSSWLVRGRRMLAKRLARRGVTLSAGSLAAVLSQSAASASVRTGLVVSTGKAATLFAAGQAAACGPGSAKVAALAEGMLKAMLLSKLKVGAALLLALAAVSAGALGLVSSGVRAAQEEGRKSPGAAVASAGAAQAEAKKPGQQSALTAEQILDHMAKAYATCKSYRDSGSVKIVFIEANGMRTVERPFTTAFVRPDRFRFEYKEKQADDQEICYVVWRRGKNVQTWWDIKPGVEGPDSLGLALAGATGVSGGSAQTVPALLLPEEIGGRRLTQIVDAKRIDDAKLGKADCFRMTGTYAAVPMTLWVDKKTYLVRRIDTQNQFANFRTEQTTTYDPLIDSEVPDKMLEFNVTKPK